MASQQALLQPTQQEGGTGWWNDLGYGDVVGHMAVESVEDVRLLDPLVRLSEDLVCLRPRAIKNMMANAVQGETYTALKTLSESSEPITQLEGCGNFDQTGVSWGVLRAFYLPVIGTRQVKDNAQYADGARIGRIITPLQHARVIRSIFGPT